MIDIENELFDKIAKTLRGKYPNIFISGISTLTPSSFPCVFVEQKDNPIDMDMADSGSVERVTTPMIEVNVYSNLIEGRKQEAKQIMETICDIMTELDIERTYCQPTPNIDTSIYRIVGRFNCKTDGKYIYRR